MIALFSHIEHELESFKPDVKADEVGTVKSVNRSVLLRAYPVQNLKNFSALQEISWVLFLMQIPCMGVVLLDQSEDLKAGSRGAPYRKGYLMFR